MVQDLGLYGLLLEKGVEGFRTWWFQGQVEL